VPALPAAYCAAYGRYAAMAACMRACHGRYRISVAGHARIMNARLQALFVRTLHRIRDPQCTPTASAGQNRASLGAPSTSSKGGRRADLARLHETKAGPPRQDIHPGRGGHPRVNPLIQMRGALFTATTLQSALIHIHHTSQQAHHIISN
jgi:hypothetical protein